MNINRRGFLFGSAAAAALAGSNTSKAWARELAPGEKRNVAMVGFGIQARLFYYEEMSLKEIAYVTESIPTTIASKLSRTRKKICKIIKMLQS